MRCAPLYTLSLNSQLIGVQSAHLVVITGNFWAIFLYVCVTCILRAVMLYMTSNFLCALTFSKIGSSCLGGLTQLAKNVLHSPTMYMYV